MADQNEVTQKPAEQQQRPQARPERIKAQEFQPLDVPPPAVAAQKRGDPLYDLVALVGVDFISLNDAGRQLRSYVAQLPDEEQKKWRDAAVGRARRLMSVAEGFAQELTLIAAGQ